MIWWVLWAIVAVACYYPFARLVWSEMDSVSPMGKGDRVDRYFGALFAMFGAAAWPVIVVGILAFQVSKRIWHGQDRTKANR